MVRRSNRGGHPPLAMRRGRIDAGEDAIRKLGRRRLLAVSGLILGVAVASTVGACAESDEFDFKPRGTRTPVRDGG